MTNLSSWLVRFPLFLFAALAAGSNPAPLVLNHVTVIDATGAPAKSDMIVITANGRISQIGKASKIHREHDAKVIDASGKFLIPGLWDMHTHWGEIEYLPLFLANGVTGLRIMWGDTQHHEGLRND